MYADSYEALRSVLKQWLAKSGALVPNIQGLQFESAAAA
jgi:hypothetical protein